MRKNIRNSTENYWIVTLASAENDTDTVQSFASSKSKMATDWHELMV